MYASLNFSLPSPEPLVVDITGSGPSNIRLETREVTLADAEFDTAAATLESHGFATAPFSATPPDGAIDGAYRKRFADLCAAAVRNATGASIVAGLPSTVAVRRGNGAYEEAPIAVAHTDFTPSSASVAAMALLKKIPAAPRPKRFAAFNTWWLASEEAQDRPLALCDATSIAASDVQVARAKVFSAKRRPVNFGEVAVLRYSERHRWYWYPRLTPDRLLIFCGFDSDPSRPSMVMHSAFDNRACPPGAPPRVSVECRCFAYW